MAESVDLLRSPPFSADRPTFSGGGPDGQTGERQESPVLAPRTWLCGEARGVPEILLCERGRPSAITSWWWTYAPCPS